MLKTRKIFLDLDNRGQGLIEVFITIYLFIVALLSIMNLVSYNIQAQNFNHNMLIASNLAREQIEIVRNIRDTNWLNPDSETGEAEWDDSLIYNDSDNNGVTINEEHPENSFYIYNNYLSEGDFKYIVNSLGLSWENCIDENFDNFGGSFMQYGALFCKVSLINIETYPNEYFYDIFGISYLPEFVTKTYFYKMLTINEICADGNNEIILGKDNLMCDNENCYDEHCSDFSLEKIGLQVISRVGWKNLDRMNTITLEDHLYNWK
ncbi:MAG: hypothetical protein PHZ07_03735 [Patescibacteria group bacterium]|nr:hypothetical protein [Patescibacteria group bacterium]MDD4304542.1 hypothetical protein [Patescibacteria group bacterium]MDD4695650.1 hypothetical protein [Patescibacteria group bacterium]